MFHNTVLYSKFYVIHQTSVKIKESCNTLFYNAPRFEKILKLKKMHLLIGPFQRKLKRKADEADTVDKTTWIFYKCFYFLKTKMNHVILLKVIYFPVKPLNHRTPTTAL